eukprot:scaffold137410_cov22-Tisochrysis_lutea.AAC.2
MSEVVILAAYMRRSSASAVRAAARAPRQFATLRARPLPRWLAVCAGATVRGAPSAAPSAASATLQPRRAAAAP